jgi:hypothetical protein
VNAVRHFKRTGVRAGDTILTRIVRDGTTRSMPGLELAVADVWGGM